MTELRTPRLTLTPISPDDFDGWVPIVSDYEVVKWTASWPWPFDPDFLRFRVSRPFPADQGYVGSVRHEGLIIGVMALTDGELGYMFRRDQWGRGFATEAARAVLDHGFATLGMIEAHAGSLDGNAGSARTLRKLGFREAGRMMMTSKSQGLDLPGPSWHLTRDDYLAHDPVFVTTKRLNLRNLTADDAERYRDIVTHPQVGPMLVIFPPDWPLDAARDHLSENQYQGRLRFRLGVEHQGHLIGAIGVSGGDEPSIFYYLDPALSGQGLASELVPAFADALLARFPVKALKAIVFTDNPASAHVLEKAGFQRGETGVLKSAARPADAPVWHYRRPAS